jgi:hypothetical protein
VGISILGVWSYRHYGAGHISLEDAAYDAYGSAQLIVFVKDFKKAQWDQEQAAPVTKVARQYDGIAMYKTGYITYQVPIGQSVIDGYKMRVFSVMCSNLHGSASQNLLFSSDVTLLMNGKEQGVQNVTSSPDRRFWDVDPAALKDGTNELTFAVKPDARYQNGLILCSQIEIRFAKR